MVRNLDNAPACDVPGILGSWTSLFPRYLPFQTLMYVLLASPMPHIVKISLVIIGGHDGRAAQRVSRAWRGARLAIEYTPASISQLHRFPLLAKSSFRFANGQSITSEQLRRHSLMGRGLMVFVNGLTISEYSLMVGIC